MKTMSQQVSIKDFQHYNVRQIIASDTHVPKRLVAVCHIGTSDITYTVYANHQSRLLTKYLEEAIEEYNRY